MRTRVMAGIVGWVAGATTATALSLVAIAHLGVGPHSTQGGPMSPGQVAKALAETTTSTATAPAAASDPASVRPSGSGNMADTTRPAAGSSTSPATGTSTEATTPTRGSTTSQPAVRDLSGDAGSVVAECEGSTVYLSSWSPAQGYQVASVRRGPASSAGVDFLDTGDGDQVRFTVTCPGGVPSLAVADGSGGADAFALSAQADH